MYWTILHVAFKMRTIYILDLFPHSVIRSFVMKWYL